jgi:hypothetical protein
MKANRVILLSCFSLLVAASWLYVTQSRADQSKVVRHSPNQKLVEAAQAALIATEADYNVNNATLEEIYQWSKRLMDAELQNRGGDAAVSRHFDRMAEKQKRVSALFQAGVRGGSAKEEAAARYYLEEAAAMVAARPK